MPLPPWLSVALSIAGAGQFAALDLTLWGGARSFQPEVLGGLVASVAVGGLVVGRVQSRFGRAALALAASVVVVSQVAYYRYYHAPLDAQVILAARFSWADVRPVLLDALPLFGLVVSLVAAVEFWVLARAQRVPVPRLVLAGLALAGWILAGSPHRSTAEVRAVHALAALITAKEASAAAMRPDLPGIGSSREQLPDVLLVIAESIRASDACQLGSCTTGRALASALPEAVVFSEARSLASYTTVALSALVTGVPQTTPAKLLAKTPDLFDFARAVRLRKTRYSIHYWSAQLPGAIGRGPLETVADEVIDAEVLLGRKTSTIEDSLDAKLDRRIAEHCERSARKVRQPRLIVMHLAGTHTPYFFDEHDAPFGPWQRKVTWSGLERLHNAYLNALYEQDKSVARCVKAFRASTGKRPWMVVYTSDHGEAFGEHNAIHHGQNLYDEQIRVPCIVAHGNGALTPREAAALRAYESKPVTHADLLPTLLDAWGVFGHFALRGFVRQMPGRSLLKSPVAHAPVPITNCTETFRCPLNTWGVLGNNRKLVAQVWDGAWRCIQLEGGEREVDRAQCRDLIDRACAVFPNLPSGDANWPCRR